MQYTTKSINCIIQSKLLFSMDYDLGTLQSEDLRESYDPMIENGYDMYYSKLSASFQMPNRINEFEDRVCVYVIDKTQFLGTKKIHSESSLQEFNQSIKGQFCPECSKSSDRLHDYFFM